MGVTKAHTLVHPGPKESVPVHGGDTAMLNKGLHLGENTFGGSRQGVLLGE
jgi:hypothetical protein